MCSQTLITSLERQREEKTKKRNVYLVSSCLVDPLIVSERGNINYWSNGCMNVKLCPPDSHNDQRKHSTVAFTRNHEYSSTCTQTRKDNISGGAKNESFIVCQIFIVDPL